MAYNPTNWYWQVLPSSAVWSSASFSYVQSNNPTYVAWLLAGNQVSLLSSTSGQTALSQIMTQSVIPVYLLSGLTVNFSAAPALSSVYALDVNTLTQIQAVAQDVACGMGFPGEVASFQYPDMSGVPRSFTSLQFIALYRALRDYVSAVNTAVAGLVFQVPGVTMPSTTTTI
jgi:hypothetical protein